MLFYKRLSGHLYLWMNILFWLIFDSSGILLYLLYHTSSYELLNTNSQLGLKIIILNYLYRKYILPSKTIFLSLFVSTLSTSFIFWLFLPEGNDNANLTWSECMSFDKVVVLLEDFVISYPEGLPCCFPVDAVSKGSFTGNSAELKRGNFTVKISLCCML